MRESRWPPSFFSQESLGNKPLDSFFVPVCAEALPTPTCRQGETDRQGKRLSVFPPLFTVSPGILRP